MANLTEQEFNATACRDCNERLCQEILSHNSVFWAMPVISAKLGKPDCIFVCEDLFEVRFLLSGMPAWELQFALSRVLRDQPSLCRILTYFDAQWDSVGEQIKIYENLVRLGEIKILRPPPDTAKVKRFREWFERNNRFIGGGGRPVAETEVPGEVGVPTLRPKEFPVSTSKVFPEKASKFETIPRSFDKATPQLKFQDATAEQEETIRQAVIRARQQVQNAINKLEQAKKAPDPLVKEYFGIDGTSQEDIRKISEVADKFKNIQKKLEGPIQFEVENEKIKPGKPYTVAYVYTLPVVGGVGDVHVCFPAFNTLEDEEQASIIVHEISHYVAGTNNYAYSWQTTKWNKMTQKGKMNNADSYSEFAKEATGEKKTAKEGIY